MVRPGDEASLFLVVHGTGTSPGRARGPLRRNREDLDPSEVAGAVLVAERSSPDDMARIVAAEGTLTLSGAFLSHVSLLSREFGRPSVSLGVREHARLLPPEEGGLLELADVVGAPGGAVRLEEGDIVVLDGESGLLTVPGGADAGARHAVRDAHRALLRAAATQDGASAAEALLPEGPGASAVLAYVLDALLLPGRPELPGALLLEGLLRDAALRERLAPLLPRVQARAERETLHRLERASTALRAASSVDALDREARALAAMVAREEGRTSEALTDARAALQEARARRDALVRELEEEVAAGLRLTDSV
ncbi:MAG TPA: PEP-utilizing enzyme, partial [Candidatus Polarisedimenticolaceae bacterium]|nr:PEP-utilizing enzyme [Candidatus Polarisedimenticolaceae bacterium]